MFSTGLFHVVIGRTGYEKLRLKLAPLITANIHTHLKWEEIGIIGLVQLYDSFLDPDYFECPPGNMENHKYPPEKYQSPGGHK